MSILLTFPTWLLYSVCFFQYPHHRQVQEAIILHIGRIYAMQVLIRTEVDVMTFVFELFTKDFASRAEILCIFPSLFERKRREAKNKFFNIPSSMLTLCQYLKIFLHFTQNHFLILFEKFFKILAHRL